MNELTIRQIVRFELQSLLREKNEEFKELKAVIEPTRLKEEIRKIISFQITENKKDILESAEKKAIQMFYRSLEPVMTEEVKLKVSEVDIHKCIIQLFERQSEKEFKPIIKNCIRYSEKHFNLKVQNVLSDVLALKTSTIQEIKGNIDNNPISEEEMFEKLDNRSNLFIE